MIKLFIKGLVFGLGFSLALAIAFAAYFAYVSSLTTQYEPVSKHETINRWGDISINEKINSASVVALIRFKDGADGLNAAYVEKIFGAVLDKQNYLVWQYEKK